MFGILQIDGKTVMKRKNIVAVIGRPNVGKSTLFNALAGKDISIVKDTQAEIAIETADVILFLCDVKQGPTDADHRVADLLRKSGKPVVLAVNKVDNFQKEMLDTYEFYQLGIGDPHPISAAGRLGIGDLLEEITTLFPKETREEEEEDAVSVAIIGKPNVGKSSIINKLIGTNRLIVSDIAGTTRDAVDTPVQYHGRNYIFIDTAGLRRKNKIKEELERFMIIRSVSAVERADVCILVIDAEEGVTEQDAKIAGIAHERGKAMIIAVNKWDLVEKDNHTVKEFSDQIRQTLAFAPYAEILFVSAKSGQRLTKLYDLIDAVSENHARRVPTGLLNEVLTQAMVMQQPPSDKGKLLRIYYMTQVAVKPPTFVLFVNDKELMHFSYTRYIENQIRKTFGFQGTPLRFLVREKSRKEI